MIALLLAALLAAPVTVTKIAQPEKALRFEVIVPATLDEVWTAFTTNQGLNTWLWQDCRDQKFLKLSLFVSILNKILNSVICPLLSDI